MKKLFALLLALVMMMSVVAIAEETEAVTEEPEVVAEETEAAPEETEAVKSPVAKATIVSFTPEGITPSVVDAEDDDTVKALLDAIAETNDNEKVFGSANVEGLNDYELVELVGLSIADYDESMGEVTLNIQFASSFEKSAQLLVLLGLIDGGEVTWQGVSFQIEDDGCLTITLTAEQAKAVAEGTAVLAVLQKKN